jgi:serine/threonine protein phosphatase 1
LKKLTATIPYNENGCDWFVGDIHGTFSKLEAILKKSGFDFSKDRLFSVGDLLDRGVESHMALEWLKQPWFYAIRGNHEDMYMTWRAYKNGEYNDFNMEWYEKNGGGWVKDLGHSMHQKIEDQVAQLPYLITILDKEGNPEIGLLHGEMPDTLTWSQLNQHKVLKEYLDQVLWSRDRLLSIMYPEDNHPTMRVNKKSLIQKLRDKFFKPEPETYRQHIFLDNHYITGLKALVCGHATIKKSFSKGNIVWIDTGGWLSYGKGHYSLLKKEEILDLVKHNNDKEIIPEFAYQGGI